MLQNLISKILSLLAEPIPLVEGHWLNITFDVPILVDINSPLTPILQFIYCSECILLFIGMFFMVYFNLFVNSIGIIHLNLQHLFVFSTVLYLMGTFARFYMIMVQLHIITDLDTPYLLVSGLLRMQQYGVSLSSILVITVERAFATYYVVDYEAKPRSWVSVFCVFVSLVYTQCYIIPICFCKCFSPYFPKPVISVKASLLYIILYAALWAVFAKIERIYCLNKRREERQVNPITVFEDVTKSYFDQFQTSWA
ncbi:hypothetical protein CAEBREN_16971 [Caenorhabditis brenneri]|uniref:Uncharacterized protein n=1 Tax=Caenorhabditis brenneri TaxID=135651 RepID=G0MPY6_CAEBE|nr:hypothetical protein CAEBREN_16971 [Caenorhabditis brenneri]